MDCTSALFKKTFPDCDVVRKFSGAHTKTETIVNSVLAPYSVESVLKTFEEHAIAYCGVSTDASNHGSIKIFPVIIQYFDWRNGGLQSKIIEIQNVPDETADTIANYVKNRPTLQKKGLFDFNWCWLPWTYTLTAVFTMQLRECLLILRTLYLRSISTFT